jgi:xanthosine phosphorylase
MNKTPNPQEAYEYIQQKSNGFKPTIGLVLGSGLNNLAEQLEEPITIPYREIPGFLECNVAGHQGTLLLGTLGGVKVACLQGRSHYYEGKPHEAMLVPIRTLKLLGCENLILTNAAASLRTEVQPGSLVVITDHINFQFQNPLVGPNDDSFGPRFPSLQQTYDKDLISIASEEAQKLNLKLWTGVYLATLGPSYETPAEIRAYKILGADVVGMSTVPEAIIASHCGMKVLAISTITNMACGMSDEFLTHEAVLQVAKKVATDLSRLLLNITLSLPASGRGQGEGNKR